VIGWFAFLHFKVDVFEDIDLRGAFAVTFACTFEF